MREEDEGVDPPEREIYTIECVRNADNTRRPHTLLYIVLLSIAENAPELVRYIHPDTVDRYLKCLLFRPSKHVKKHLRVIQEIKFSTQNMKTDITSDPLNYTNILGRYEHGVLDRDIWGPIDSSELIGGCKRFWLDCLKEGKISTCMLEDEARGEFTGEELDKFPNCIYYRILGVLRRYGKSLIKPSEAYPTEEEVRAQFDAYCKRTIPNALDVSVNNQMMGYPYDHDAYCS